MLASLATSVCSGLLVDWQYSDNDCYGVEQWDGMDGLWDADADGRSAIVQRAMVIV